MKKFKSVRYSMSIVVFCLVLAVSLLMAGLYFLFVFLKLIPHGTVLSLWMPVIVIVSCSCIGAAAASIFSSYFLKPLDEVTDAVKNLSKGEFDTNLDIAKRDNSYIKDLKIAVNKTSQELKSIENMRSDFANTLSHEYKTPAASILGYAKILKNSDLSQSEKEKYTDIIIEEAMRLSSMTNDILLLTKYENTRIIQDKKSYSLDEQIRSCVQLLSNQWLAKNISMSGDLNEVEYYGNETLMSHIWLNLLDNAIKFSKSGGEISISLTQDSDKITVCISDNGRGISDDDIEHIFEEFYRSDNEKNSSGSGLGLSIVKRLVDLCNGEISVTSKENEGSSFTVILPKDNK